MFIPKMPATAPKYPRTAVITVSNFTRLWVWMPLRVPNSTKLPVIRSLAGFVRAMWHSKLAAALSEQCGTAREQLLAAENDPQITGKAAQSVPVL